MAHESPVNLGFEEAGFLFRPVGWDLWTERDWAGFVVFASGARPAHGERCAGIFRWRPRVRTAWKPGFFTQTIDGAPFRGRTIRLRAAVRAELSHDMDRAQLWLRVESDEDTPMMPDLRETVTSQPIRHNDWRYHEVRARVPEAATKVTFGLRVLGAGSVWLDHVALDAVDPDEAYHEPPRALQGRALENLIAFTRLLGYVRFFHPSDEASCADWETFAIRGVREVEGAGSPGELAEILERLFCPLAPTVRVFPTGEAPNDVASGHRIEDDAGRVALAWEHRGVGTHWEAFHPGWYMRYYTSGRIAIAREPDGSFVPRSRSGGGASPGAGFPSPDRPLRADIGGGVTSIVPLAVFTDKGHTVPPASRALRFVKPEVPASWVASGNDRATRLADVALTWTVLQHFYPYFDDVSADWPGALSRALRDAATDPDASAFLLTLERMLAELRDGHGRVGHPQSLRQYGPGLLWEWIGDRLVVTHVEGAAADTLRPGDVVLAIDGASVGDALAAAMKYVSAATEEFARLRALGRLRRGPEGSTLGLEVERGGRVFSVELRRTIPAWERGRLREKRPPKVEELEPGIRYVDLTRVTGEEFESALPALAEASGIIFDMRGYPRVDMRLILSRLTDRPVNSPQWHVPTIRRPDREGVEFEQSEWSIEPREPLLTGRVAFLTDRRAVSAAETFLGIVEHYRLGEIVGGPTAGTNGNVSRFSLPGRYSIGWTGMKVLKHDGSRHHGVGIQPTIPISRTIEGVAAGRDEVLERAVALVSD